MGVPVRLCDNGLRQGCVLSPLLCLVIINALVSDAPKAHMPAWDKGYKNLCYKQGVQPLREMKLPEWEVYLFGIVTKD